MQDGHGCQAQMCVWMYKAEDNAQRGRHRELGRHCQKAFLNILHHRARTQRIHSLSLYFPSNHTSRKWGSYWIWLPPSIWSGQRLVWAAFRWRDSLVASSQEATACSSAQLLVTRAAGLVSFWRHSVDPWDCLLKGKLCYQFLGYLSDNNVCINSHRSTAHYFYTNGQITVIHFFTSLSHWAMKLRIVSTWYV